MKSRHEPPKKRKKKRKSKPVFNDISRGSFPSSSASFPGSGVRKKNLPRIMIDGVRCERGKRKADTRGINLDLLLRYIHRGKKLKFIEANAFLTIGRGYIPFRSPLSFFLFLRKDAYPLPTSLSSPRFQRVYSWSSFLFFLIPNRLIIYNLPFIY